MENEQLTDIQIRWNNGIDLVLTVLLYKDTIGEIKQLVCNKSKKKKKIA